MAAMGIGAACAASAQSDFAGCAAAFTSGYEALDVEHFALDVKERLANVATWAQLDSQQAFFTAQQAVLARYPREKLSGEDRLLRDLMAYEVDFHLQRIALEKRWSKAGRPMPVRCLHELPEHGNWYRLWVRRFTGTDITPEEVFRLGERETQRCLREIDSLRVQLGSMDSSSFRLMLAGDRFVLTRREDVVDGFARIDSTVRTRLKGFVMVDSVPPVRAVEWPDAGPNTPPGMYLAREENPLHEDLFQYNFFGARYNSRSMGWIYLHEAIPGHHLQSWLRRRYPHSDLRADVSYPGNFEGWACYVEYHGDELGVYDDPFQRIGKWEWDLVRSVRLVLDAGINYYGWSREEALAWWKAHIPGQDAIAEREVARVTNWAAQALSYKVGADRLQRLHDAVRLREGARFNAARFHREFLDLGQVPIAVVEQHFLDP